MGKAIIHFKPENKFREKANELELELEKPQTVHICFSLKLLHSGHASFNINQYNSPKVSLMNKLVITNRPLEKDKRR